MKKGKKKGEVNVQITGGYREEKFTINLGINEESLTEADKDILKHSFNTKLAKYDNATITYTLDIEYLGRVAERLQAILALWDKAVVKEARTEELRHGKCLIQDILLKIESLEHKLEKRSK